MDRLTREITLYIAEDLHNADIDHYGDEKELMAVNSQICKWIRDNNFFSKVLFDNKSNTDEAQQILLQDEFLNFFEKSGYGKQTKKITFRSWRMRPDSFSRLTRAFPNVEYVESKVSPRQADGEEEEEEDSGPTTESTHGWKSLKEFVGYGGSEFLDAVLSAPPDMTTQLKEVCLRYTLQRPALLRQAFSDIPKFQNATHLQSVMLIDGPLSIEVLDYLQQNMPGLKSLIFIDPKCGWLDSSVPKIKLRRNRFKKRENLDHLSIVFDEDQYDDVYANWVDFIFEVYPDLLSFELFFRNPLRDYFPEHEYEEFICRSLSNWHNLKSYNFKFYPLTDRILGTMKSSGIRLQKLTIYTCAADVDGFYSSQKFCIIRHLEVVSELETLHVKGDEHLGLHNDRGWLALLLITEFMPCLKTLKLSLESEEDISIEADGLDLVAGILDQRRSLSHLEIPPSSYSLEAPRKEKLNGAIGLVSLKIEDVIVDLDKYSVDGLNERIKALLHQSLFLESFDIKINFDTPGSTKEDVAVMFNFEEMRRLREVKITMRRDTIFEIRVGKSVKTYRKNLDRYSMSPRSGEPTDRVVIKANRGTTIITEVEYNFWFS